MTNEYKGAIIEESLADNRLLNNLDIIKVRISNDENPADRWHIYTVKVNQEEIEKLAQNIKPKWYMHFWNDQKDIIAIFENKKFKFNYEDKASWSPAIDYGLSQGIPKEQLDFLID
ncbi:MAG: hypothetical protein WCP18_04425 [bacterium]